MAGRFRLVTTNGERVDVPQVVVAVGALPFSYAPDPFAPYLGERVTFAAELSGTPVGPGDTVAVIGAGQAAVEAAMDAARRGAAVEFIARTPMHWFAEREPWQPRGALARRLYELAYPALGYGPPLLNRLVLHPDFFALLPRAVRDRLARRVLRAGTSEAAREELEAVARMTDGVRVEGVESRGHELALRLSDGTSRTVSLVVLATGYRFQLERLRWLASDIRRDIRFAGQWPRLDRGFQSNVEGLRFVGYAAEGRYGPLSRFVLGTRFTADRVAVAIARRARESKGLGR
jgi:lysine/ornithine N-monooxygenase